MIKNASTLWQLTKNGTIALSLVNPTSQSVTVGKHAFCQKTKLTDSSIVKDVTERLYTSEFIVVPTNGNKVANFSTHYGELSRLILETETTLNQEKLIPKEKRFLWRCILGLTDTHGKIESNGSWHFTIWQIGNYGSATGTYSLPINEVPGGGLKRLLLIMTIITRIFISSNRRIYHQVLIEQHSLL